MNGTTFNLLLALFLLAANAFFVAAEFALVKTKGFRMDALAEEDRFGARLAQRMLGNVEAYLACCQLGITMASLGLGWVGEPTVAALLEPLLSPLGMPQAALQVTAFVVGFLVFSSLHIVLGEQVPKTLAIREPEPVSLWIAYPLHVVFVLFYPLNWPAQRRLASILRVLGVREASHQDILTDVEIEGLVEVSAEHGKMEESQAEYIHNLFRFGELEVVRRDGPPHQHADGERRRAGRRRSSTISSPAPTPASRSGRTSRRTSSASSTPRTSCGR